MKIGRGYFRTHILRKPTLRVIEFSITAACQSKCEFCYASKFHKRKQEPLTLAEIKNTWEQAKELGAFSSVVFGGEPLLRPDFLDIIATLEPMENIVTFTSNAISLTEEMVIELKRLGVYVMNFSLNSLDPQLNDQIRGYAGHYDKVMQAIAWCKKHDIDVFLPVATSRPYLAETGKIIDFARQIGASVTINLMAPMGRAEKGRGELFDQEFWTTFREWSNNNPDMRSDFDVNLSMKIECPAGFEKIHVAPYGEVTGCSMNPASFGNVREMPLREIVEKMRSFRHFSKRHPSCIVAVDDEYIQDYMNFSHDYHELPYPVEENPKYGDDK